MTSMGAQSGNRFGTGFRSIDVIVTSADGSRQQSGPPVEFQKGPPRGDVLRVRPQARKQTLLGIGTSITEASAFVLAHLEANERKAVMEKLFTWKGANFSMTRIPVGSCDFCVEGKYSYADTPGDTRLADFDIGVDADGFSKVRHPGIIDESYDVLPMIQEVLAMKARQPDSDFRIVASAWTAPAWMKDIGDWYQPPSEANGFEGSGGALLPGYESVYADYLVKYLEAYQEQGVDVWGLTPVNEPLGNSGKWESMHFSPSTQRTFIRDELGPRLRRGGFGGVNLLVLDHARTELERWVDEICSDPECARYVAGAAVHWYDSTRKVYEDVFQRVHQRFPDLMLVHTEGCIDDLGNDAPEGVLDPVRFKESNWFDNDDFWWGENATDWAYSATWAGVDPSDHPSYTPVHRYARDIIVCMNNWVSGWIDWNCVLDQRGGPNHVGNHCGAPVMVNLETGYVYYTPVFEILSQLSRTIRPGDTVVQTDFLADEVVRESVYGASAVNDTGLLCIQLLNTSGADIVLSLQVEDQYAPMTLKANSLQTVRIQLDESSTSTGVPAKRVEPADAVTDVRRRFPDGRQAGLAGVDPIGARTVQVPALTGYSV